MKKTTLIVLAATVALLGARQIATASQPTRAATFSQVVVNRNPEGKLLCPVMHAVIESEAKAFGYSDYKGKRYYFCCDGCKPLFDKEPAKYASVEIPKKDSQEPTEIAPINVGKYQIELWPPEDGVFAGEGIDIEFGVFDTTKKDPEIGGMLGVDFEAKAEVTMPSMPGMPVQRPHIHKEGRAGVQGLELFFPHGGEYRIDLTITPKGQKSIKAAFTIPVGDEKPAEAAKKQPYNLEIVDFPQHATAGQPLDLKMRVIDTKTGKAQTKFDIAHEQNFHLLIASKDLSLFMHEHPTMAPDGTWTYRVTFPAGGDWWVYGDVAPVGKGSRILVNKVSLHGDPPKGGVLAAPNLGPSADGGLVGHFDSLVTPIPIGKMTTVRVKLTDEKTGQPAGDTQPWLGAAGHLMIIHEDGQTIVHSHPKEDEETHALVKKGEIHFTGRFPKPGTYRAYAQFQRGGQIKTLGFTIEVKP